MNELVNDFSNNHSFGRGSFLGSHEIAHAQERAMFVPSPSSVVSLRREKEKERERESSVSIQPTKQVGKQASIHPKPKNSLEKGHDQFLFPEVLSSSFFSLGHQPASELEEEMLPPLP